MKDDRFFCINVNRYIKDRDFEVYRPASFNRPKDHSVMFCMGRFADRAESFVGVKNSLIFWDRRVDPPEIVKRDNAVVLSDDARLEYCRFFKTNNIRNLPKPEPFSIIGGATICDGASIDPTATIMPNCYISSESIIGKSCYIGAGARLVGRVTLGDSVTIRENTVIGADGLSTDRDKDGKAITMPQFGGVVIGDRVEIGANTVIARGAIDDTVIGEGVKIDNSSFISHNVEVGDDTFIVGETIMFGGSRTGKRVFVSGNSTIRNKVSIGDDAFIGMGSVVTGDVAKNTVVMGNPARERQS